jgi:hypothetical protein
MSIHSVSGPGAFDAPQPDQDEPAAPAAQTAPAAAQTAPAAPAAAAAATAPSNAFDGARFSPKVVKNADGSLDASFGEGVDMGGKIHADPSGKLSWETRPVMMRPGPLQPMSDPDRASLAQNLEKYLAKTPSADASWKTILADAQPPAPPSGPFGGARWGKVTENDDGSIDATYSTGVDMVGHVHAAADGNIAWEQHPVMMRPGPLQPMPDADRAGLAKSLSAAAAKPGADPGLEDLADVAAAPAPPPPTGVFAMARFASVKENDDGSIDASFGSGVDMGGKIHLDPDGNVTWEQRPVMMRPGPLQPMSDADQASLAAGLQAYLDRTPGADPAWQDLLDAITP